MKISSEKRELDDIEKIKKFLDSLGFVCNSYPSAQNHIYSKNRDTVIVRNNKKD